MIKSSDVLKLAAEYELVEVPYAYLCAILEMEADEDHLTDYTWLVGWAKTKIFSGYSVLALCLAAAIAESEGD